MRNAEATRERILEAALAEFSAHGIAGARVDRIAQSARCNKNLIYIYFTDKETLFTTVLLKHLLRVHEELPFTPDDLPGYAGTVFDFAMANPDLMRLMAWSALEQKAQGPTERIATLEEKIRALTEAQEAGQVGTAFPPSFLVTAVMSLATAWSAAGSFGPSLDPKAAERRTELRQNITEAVRLLADAGKRTHTPGRRKSR
ncbi:MAG TPA: TetR family transcriptional regulator [Gemmataceae bacterium]|jgi:AcrR family transcriptional regulator|nr:TetR family transcriptional regulator [Gemmataceae bacterium]